ncbi:hypothetical protein DMUE_4912 [Dictyocoela muelleri]|nr:hypothetical protein DMUE_4912 [Dictyocoela muelleri]
MLRTSSTLSEKTDLKNMKLQLLDNQTFEVFLWLRRKNIPLNGTCYKMIARKIAMKLDLLLSEALNGWIENFKKRHVLSFKNISGELISSNFLEVESFRT